MIRAAAVLRELVGDDLDPLRGDAVDRRRRVGERGGDRREVDAGRVASSFASASEVRLRSGCAAGGGGDRRWRRSSCTTARRRRAGSSARAPSAASRPRGEVLRRADHPRLGLEEVRVEREDDAGRPCSRTTMLTGWPNAMRAPSRALDSFTGAHVCTRALREAGREHVAQANERRRVRRLGEDAELRAAVGRERRDLRPSATASKSSHFASAPRFAGAVRAVRIVQVEERRLRDARRCAPRLDGCSRVPLDLRRAPLVVLDEQADRVAAVRAHRRVVNGDAREHVLGRVRVRQDVLDRTARAPFDGEERGAQAAEEEAATSDRPEAEIAPGLLARELRRRLLRRELGARLLLEALPEDGRAVLLRVSSSYGSRLLIDGTRSSSAEGSRRGSLSRNPRFERRRLEASRRSPTSCS